MSSWWLFKRKIATLPNVALTPEVVLARTLEKAQGRVTHADGSTAPTIRAVYLGIEFWDHTFVYDYSSMGIRDLLMHQLVLQRRIDELARGCEIHDGDENAPLVG